MASDEITRALGIPDLNDFEFHRVRKQILSSAVIWDRICAELLVERAPKVLANLHPLERKAMREKCGYPEETPEQRATLDTWTIRKLPGQFGTKYLHVACPRCRQDANFLRPEIEADVVTYNDNKQEVSRYSPNSIFVDQVAAVLGRLRWQHCGTESRPPVDLLKAIEEAWLQGAIDRPRAARRD